MVALQRTLDQHLAWVEKRSGGVQADLSGITLNEAKLTGVNLQGAVLRSSFLMAADLTGSNCAGAVFERADLRRAIFANAGADFTEALLDMSWLAEAGLCDVKLRNTAMRKAFLRQARFLDASIHGCDLSWSTGEKISFHQCRIFQSIFTQVQLPKSLFYNARIQLSRFTAASLKECNFSNARIIDCDFTSADLEESRFNRADLTRSQFVRAALGSCDLRESTLKGSSFQDASLTGARFGGANLFTADLRGADLRGARELTQEQLAQSLTDYGTVLPNGSHGPFVKHSGAERPR